MIKMSNRHQLEKKNKIVNMKILVIMIIIIDLKIFKPWKEIRKKS